MSAIQFGLSWFILCELVAIFFDFAGCMPRQKIADVPGDAFKPDPGPV